MIFYCTVVLVYDFKYANSILEKVLVKSADLLTPSEPDAVSSAPEGNI